MRLILALSPVPQEVVDIALAERSYRLRPVTDEGLRAIGIDPNEGDAGANTAPTGAEDTAPQGADAPPPEPAQAAPLTEEIALLDEALAARTTTPRTSLRDAAAAVLAAWDDKANRAGDITVALDAPMEALRTLLVGKPCGSMRQAQPARRM